MLIDEAFCVYVKRGFANYIPEELTIDLKITPTMKTRVKRVLGRIKIIMKEEELPPISVAKKEMHRRMRIQTNMPTTIK